MATLTIACNGGGGDTPSSSKPSLPSSPKHLTAVPGDQRVTLTWDRVTEASGYTLYWSDSPGISKATANVVANVSPGFQHQGLDNGQAYYYRVTAANGGGESLPSDEIVAIPGGHTIADVVSDANLRHCLSSHASGSPAYADAISGEVDCSYRGITNLEGLQYLAAANAINLAGNAIQDVLPLQNLTALVALDLSNNQLGRNAETVLTRLIQDGSLSDLSVAGNPLLSCEFIESLLTQVSATDVSGAEPGANCTAYQQVPAPGASSIPTGVRAIPGNGQVTLIWDEVSGASHYVFYWQTSGGVDPQSATAISEVHAPYVHTSLTNGTTYYYVVSAVIGGQEGQPSEEVFTAPSDQGAAIDGVFTDANLQACVSEYAVSKGWTFIHEITGYLDCASRSIANLQGMEQLVELSSVNLMNNAITATGPLTGLPHLARLYLSNNQIDDLSGLSNLPSLRFVNLGRNRIANISSLPGLSQLTELYLNDNQIVDVNALASLTDLQIVDLRRNAIGGEEVGNVDSLASLVNAGSILLAGNDGIACVELAALVAAVGPNVVDISANLGSIYCQGVPQAPANLNAAGGNQRVILTWDAVINAATYNIYWSNTPSINVGNSNKIANVRSGYQHTGLINGLAYYYVVTAENAAGESAISEEVNVVPQQVVLAGLFADANMQACIDELAALHRWTTAEQVTGIVNCSARAITNVSGIEHLTAVSRLSLNENNLADIVPIGYLTTLRSLSLYRNNINSVDALVNMAALNELFISNNVISRVHTLSGLPQLSVVDLRYNRIGSNGSGGVDQLAALSNATLISLAGNPTMSCEELQSLLNAVGSNVVDVNSVVTGQNCTRPSLVPAGLQAVGGNGQISLRWDAVSAADGYTVYWSTSTGVTPLNGQPVNVTDPRFTHTALNNDTTYYYVVTSLTGGGESAPSVEIAAQPSANGVPLMGLFPDRELADCVNALAAANSWSYALEVSSTLNCSAQQIADVSGLEHLLNLSVLRLGSNNIEDISSLAPLVNLTFLDLYNNAISDISPLSGLSQLRILYLHNNAISEVSALAGLSNLDYLILDENNISDPTPVTGLVNLTRLFFRGNLLNDISSFSQLGQLTELYLNNNSIVNVGPLANLVYLQQLDLRSNQIGGEGVGRIDTLASLTNVSRIRLSGNNLISCNELSALVGVLGPNATDLGEAQQGVNCQAP